MNLFDTELLKDISLKMREASQTIAVAESVTSGLLQFAFSNAPDGAQFFQGGMTAYNIAQKYKFLQVEPIHALSVNCVSEKIAIEMAINICHAFTSDWGIGITGYATPSPESGNKLYAYYAIVFHNKVMKVSKIELAKTEPPDVQFQYCSEVLRNCLKLLK